MLRVSAEAIYTKNTFNLLANWGGCKLPYSVCLRFFLQKKIFWMLIQFSFKVSNDNVPALVMSWCRQQTTHHYLNQLSSNSPTHRALYWMIYCRCPRNLYKEHFDGNYIRHGTLSTICTCKMSIINGETNSVLRNAFRFICLVVGRWWFHCTKVQWRIA